MKGSWTVPRILAISGIVTMIVGGIGFIVVMMLNAFVLDEFDAYGEVPIPGTGQVQLPAGEVQISFHTSVTGSPSGSFPIPALKLGIDPPQGAPEPVLTENRGTTTTVNSDTHIRIWTAQVPVAGVYQIRTGGDVNGYINPRLAFGHESNYDYLHWVFAGLFGVGMLDLIMSRVLARMRGRRQPAGVGLQEMAPVIAPVDPYTPSDEGVRLEQLKTISALRDSGALSPEEFEAEKRRILGG
jgi:hypothetical protein